MNVKVQVYSTPIKMDQKEGLLKGQGVRDVVSLLRQKELIPISIRAIKENRSFISIAGQHGISLKICPSL